MKLSSLIALRPGLEAHPSGALWIARSRTLLIADLHLGYGWAQRRKGELGPLADEVTRELVLKVTGELRPERIVFVGDIVHAPRPCIEEREWIESVLGELSARAELIAVRGNHDRCFAREFPHLAISTVECWGSDRIIAVHGDQLPAVNSDPEKTLVLGHLHPALAIYDAAGAGQRLPVFLVNQRCIVLPAFSPFARGYNLAAGLPRDLLGQFGREEIEAYAASRTRVVRLGNLWRVLERAG